MDRRTFLQAGIGSAVGGMGAWGAWQRLSAPAGPALSSLSGPQPPAYSVIPVVGDGKWIWTQPPTGSTGYLEPRTYDLKVGIQLNGNGSAGQIMATTPVPVPLPEQKLEEARIETQGCAAQFRQLAPEAAQLVMAAPSIVKGQTIGAVAHFRVKLFKEYQGYQKEQFPVSQQVPKEMQRLYMYDSPGIQTRQKEVRELAAKVAGQIEHPWDKARAFMTWVWENIKPKIGYYTSVVAAIRDRVGDCEEHASVFAAFCRVSGIPARLVWVPNHNWAEFYLTDEQGQGHWIPAHTSCYSWFGWTGAHELVLQKGDSIRVPEKREPLRLLADWMQWQGVRPEAHYLAELTPVATTANEDAGPGARRKDDKGEWLLVGNHPMERYMRR